MKVLILSCNTGGGHNAAGFALKEQLEARGHQAVFFDYLTLAGEKVSKRVEDVYVNVVKEVPHAFGAAYKAGMAVSRITKKSPVYYVNGKMAKYLETYLEREAFDAIVMPHLYPAETITYMKRKGFNLSLTVAVMTDYTCIPFWEETCCDYYIAPHKDLIPQCVRRGIPKEKLIPAGIPVSSRFSMKTGRKKARELLGLPLEKKVYLVIGGSMGAGNLQKLAARIWKENERDVSMVLICGSNQKVCEKLEKKYRGEEDIFILGKTNKMPLYMKACDIVYTKPGGLTSTEAAVSEIPLVHTSEIPGCETENRRFFKRLGMCISPKSIKEQARAGKKLLTSKEGMEKMKKSQRLNIPKDAAERIAILIEEKIQKKCTDKY